eukprot:3967813-Pyramimonas_sp.AAC.1
MSHGCAAGVAEENRKKVGRDGMNDMGAAFDTNSGAKTAGGHHRLHQCGSCRKALRSAHAIEVARCEQLPAPGDWARGAAALLSIRGQMRST